MRISLGDVTLWFDLSGPSVIPRGDTAVERPTLVAVHGGPGLDHINMKAGLAPLWPGQLPVGTTRLVRMPQARHNIFRDRPDLAFPAVEEFIRHVKD
jgi:hypothetical protein